MNEREALLRAVLEAPDDDAPRLVYADWLEEHGEAERAEFIRVDCALAAVGHPPKGCRDLDCPCYPLLLHKRDLAATERSGVPNSRRWAYYFRPGDDWSFRRGFIETVELGCDDFIARAGLLFRWHPIREVQLIGRRPSASEDPFLHFWNAGPTGFTRISAKYYTALFWENGGSGWVEHSSRPEQLPEALFRRLEVTWDADWQQERCRRSGRSPEVCFYCPSAETGSAALSRACVAYGRELAGLPPLPAQVPGGSSP